MRKKQTKDNSWNRTKTSLDKAPLTEDDKRYINSKSYSYGMSNNFIENNAFISKLRKLVKPFVRNFRKLRERLEESASRRRRIVYGMLIGTMCICLIIGHFWKNEVIVTPTSINFPKKFINGDTIKISNYIYDTQNKAIQLDLTTTSPTGSIRPKDLKIKFTLAAAQASNTNVPFARILPTYNNHFVVLIKNIYPNFQGIKIEFYNSSIINLSSLQNALNDNSNGQNNDDSNADIKNDSSIGAYKLTDKEKDVLDSSDYSTNDQDSSKISTSNRKLTKKQLHLLNRIQKHNTQYIVLAEKKLLQKKHLGHIDINTTPKELTINALKQSISTLHQDIDNRKKLINKDKPYIAKQKEKLKELNEDADIDPSYQDKVSDAQNEINITKNDIAQQQNRISLDKLWIKKYNNRISLIKKGKIQIDKGQQPSKAIIWKDK